MQPIGPPTRLRGQSVSERDVSEQDGSEREAQMSATAGHTAPHAVRRAVDVVRDGAVLRLSGDLDVRTTASVRHAMLAALDEHARVELDLAGVANVDLVALRMIAAATHRAARSGRRLVVTGPRPSVVRLILLAHLARSIRVERVAVPLGG